ncbi:MAG: hypothetical protein EXR62_17455 [Chloroflexi bacterium]|nr:hypothetical protein [Chloroflexota bacterium]
MFLPRWQAVDASAAHCTDCHTPHQTAQPAQQFIVQTQAEATCQRCHRAVTTGVLQERDLRR